MNNQNNDMPEGFKMTELGLLPEEWETVSLGNIVQVYDSQRIPLREEERQKKKGIYPYCGANGIIDHIDEYIFDGEFLLLAEDGGYWHQFDESSYVINGKFWVNNHAHVLAAIDSIANNHYLMYSLNYSDISVFIGGTTRGKLTQGVMKSIPVTLPPLPEQKAIARVLSTIQKAVEAQDKIITAARELKKSLMRHLFTYGPVPVSEAEKVLLKETEIGPLPEHWEVVRLGDFSEIRYGLGQPPATDVTGVPIIRATNIKRGRIELAGLLRVKPEAIPLTRRSFLRNGDIIVVRSGAYTGDVALITPEWENSVAGYDLVVSPGQRVHSSYCSQLLLTNRVQSYFRSQRDRSAQPHINAHQLAAALIQVPSITEQQEIARMLSAVDKKIETEEKRKAALQTLFKTMLHQLMTGKVRVKEMETQVS